ncbi:MAG TPA: sensor histidine kinase [Saprospiraceae bacterium]|nr:sensor histidine kinase [Saprospiraceae bacterium]HMQ81303.1 sensor histidine kinase [Saprospiraceae bacterium]
MTIILVTFTSKKVLPYKLKNLKNIRHPEHAAFWLFIYLFVFDYHFWDGNWGQALWDTFVETITYAAIVYLNLLVFIPHFVQKKKPVLFVLACLALIVGYITFLRLTGLEAHFYDAGGWRNFFSMVLNTSLFLIISTLYWYFKQWQVERERQLILRSEKLEAELNFLRTQISPHFIFNTLNNIYALALQRHENTAPMVAKLSALMRYVLYEGNRGDVVLKKETETLRQYIELHLLRKPRSQNVDFYMEGNLGTWKIVPMLLINLVENCFKHSNIDGDENAFIKISGEIGSDGQFVFSTENSVARSAATTGSGGIGLENVRRQLELNYPGRHQLDISRKGNFFETRLSVQLTSGSDR